jgi:hypothetical protein
MLWLLIALDCATLRPFVVETIAPALHARAEMQPSTCLPGLAGTEETRSIIARTLHQQPHSSSLSICGFRHPTRGYVQLQWYVPIAAPLACIPIYVMSLRTSLAPSVRQEHVCPFHPTSISLQDSPRTASHPFIRRPRSLTCGHVSFLPSTSHVFRLRHNRTGNNVADVRLLRPSPSGAA